VATTSAARAETRTARSIAGAYVGSGTVAPLLGQADDGPMSPRIAPLEPPYTPEIEDTLRRLMGAADDVEPLKLFRTLAHHEVLLQRFRQIGSALLSFGTIEPIEREVVIHRVTARAGAAYEWGVHAAIFAPQVGLDAARTWTGSADDFEDERQRLLVRLADELHDTASVSDELYAGLAAHWSEPQIVELLCLAGFYRLVSYLVNGLQVEPEPWAVAAPDR
jgi:4-carboxymuconolactone decarboxylase